MRTWSREALARLRSIETRRRMGANARRLFAEVYRDMALGTVAARYERLGLIVPPCGEP
jgi:hypothetical protein